MHRATGTSYSPILACGTRMREKTKKKPIFLKTQNKHFYWLYSNEILDIKALEYKEYFTHIDLCSEEFTSYLRYCGNGIPNVWPSGE
jgi:hypothetical protein